MNNEQDMVLVPVAFLHSLLDIRREHYKVCALFSIPLEKRGDTWVGDGIIERIKTYLQSYVIRKSTLERETQAAFLSHISPNISDPIFEGDHETMPDSV